MLFSSLVCKQDHVGYRLSVAQSLISRGIFYEDVLDENPRTSGMHIYIVNPPIHPMPTTASHHPSLVFIQSCRSSWISRARHRESLQKGPNLRQIFLRQLNLLHILQHSILGPSSRNDNNVRYTRKSALCPTAAQCTPSSAPISPAPPQARHSLRSSPVQSGGIDDGGYSPADHPSS